MSQLYNIATSRIVAQAYGSDVYGAQQYNGNTTGDTGTGTETAPNTGFFGLSTDAAIGTIAGGLLVAVAVVGIVFVIVARVRAHKKKVEG